MDSGFRRNDEQNRKSCRDRPPCLSDALLYKGQPQRVVPTNDQLHTPNRENETFSTTLIMGALNNREAVFEETWTSAGKEDTLPDESQ